VAILDEAFEGIDRAIANTEKNLANSRELFESYLKAIFTQKGDGWVEKKLGDVCNFSQGIQVETKLQLETMNHDGLVRFLRIVDFTQGNEALRYIENPGIKYIVNERDVSLVRYGASTGFVCRGLNGAIANNLFKVLPKQNNLTNEYIYYFLCSSTFQNEIKRVMGGAAMPAISFGLIKNIKMLIPSLSDQEAVVRRLDLFNIQTQRLETIYRQKIAALKELKQSILQKVFTGELTADTPKTVKEEIAA
jgi:type I restriction enzyme S subunit